MLSQTDTVINGVSDPLAFEELRPSRMSFVFISVVLVTLCPLLLAAVSFHPSARPGAVGPPLGVAPLPARDQRAGRAQGQSVTPQGLQIMESQHSSHSRGG